MIENKNVTDSGKKIKELEFNKDIVFLRTNIKKIKDATEDNKSIF